VNNEEMRCAVCSVGLGVTFHDGGFVEPFCNACRQRYPESLLKAVIDQFSYALKLRTGEIVMFDECRITGDYAHLKLSSDEWKYDSHATVEYGYHRGIDVRVDDIVWCVDAPSGS